MNQAQKTNGEWVILESRTGGFYDGENLVANVFGEIVGRGYKQIIVTL